jgi:hypothetical protein
MLVLKQHGDYAPELLGRSPMLLRDRYGRAEPILTTGGKAEPYVVEDLQRKAHYRVFSSIVPRELKRSTASLRCRNRKEIIRSPSATTISGWRNHTNEINVGDRNALNYLLYNARRYRCASSAACSYADPDTSEQK